MTEQGTETKVTTRWNRYHIALVLVGALVAVAVVALPFAIASMAENLKSPIAANAFHIVPGRTAGPVLTAVNVEAVDLNAPGRSLSLAITGDRSCHAGCGAGEILRLFSLTGDPRHSAGAAPAADVSIPANGEVNQTVSLPVSGGLGAYPFDNYRLVLGVALLDKTSAQQAVPIAPAAALRQLDISVGEEVPRLDMATPVDLSQRFSFVGAPVAVAARLDFSRPFYLQALTVLIIVFIAIATIYSATTRAFKEIIGTVGVIVLGIWGVRTLLVGSFPPDATSVDLVLTLLIFVILAILAVRGIAELRETSRTVGMTAETDDST